MPRVLIFENVENVLSYLFAELLQKYLKSLEELGYNSSYKVLNSKDYGGIPQNRARVFCVSILSEDNKEFIVHFPKKIKREIEVSDLLEKNVDAKYFLSYKALNGILHTTYDSSKLENRIPKNGVMPTLCARDYKDPKLVFEDKILIKNNTEQGYLEAELGDGINISSRMEHQRGNVQKGIIKAIQCDGGNGIGVVVEKPLNLTENNENNDKCVYSDGEKGLFTEDGNIKRYVDSDIIDEFKEGQCATTNYIRGYGHGTRTHNLAVTLTTKEVQSVKVRDTRQCEKKCSNCKYYSSITFMGFNEPFCDKSNVKIEKEIYNCLNFEEKEKKDKNLAIRKITPKESTRLMAFEDKDYDAMTNLAKISASGIYHICGDAIVCSCFANLLNGIFDLDAYEDIRQYVLNLVEK